MAKGKLVIITGPSAGVGKDTIVQLFLKKHPDWVHPVSTTTRPIRPGEQEGLNYHFVSREQFKKAQAANEFLEAFEINSQWYGTLAQPLEQLLEEGRNIILRKDVQGALAIKKMMPEAVAIFLGAETPEVLEQRIRDRQTETEIQIRQRLELAKEEMKSAPQFDHVIVNPTGHPEEAVTEIEKIMES